MVIHKPKIAIVGSGNVASHICPALAKIGNVAQVCSRTIGHAAALADKIGCEAIDNPSKINADNDIVLVSVNDDSIVDVASRLSHLKGIVAHTSGSVSIEALRPYCGKCGVFYPLQTFSRNSALDISEIPFFIEGSDPEVSDFLKSLVEAIGATPYFANSNERRQIHMAAVFACNFTNHLLGISNGILKQAGYPLSVLRPLLQTTINKAMDNDPFDVQTGPAARGDIDVINAHAAKLSGKDKEIYELMSDAIMRKHHLK